MVRAFLSTYVYLFIYIIRRDIFLLFSMQIDWLDDLYLPSADDMELLVEVSRTYNMSMHLGVGEFAQQLDACEPSLEHGPAHLDLVALKLRFMVFVEEVRQGMWIGFAEAEYRALKVWELQEAHAAYGLEIAARAPGKSAAALAKSKPMSEP